MEKCFDSDIIINFEELVSKYRFHLKGISTPIVLEVYKDPKTGRFVCVQSHFIKTPLQISKYVSSVPSDEKKEWLVCRTVNSFVQYYNEAMNQGYEPSDDWLVENKDFK